MVRKTIHRFISLSFVTLATLALGNYSLAIAQTETASIATTSSPTLEELMKKHAPADQYCKFQVLKKLGWTVEEQEGDKVGLEVRPGSPCDRNDLTEAKNMGDLRLIYTRNSSSSTFDEKDFINNSLDDLLGQVDQTFRGVDSRCSYKYKVGQAVQKAAQKLVRNTQDGLYTFGTTSTHFCQAEGDEWNYIGSPFSSCMTAKHSPKAAMDCFYSKNCQSECAVGLQVGQLATLRELYGDDFDKAFTPEEITVGTWGSVSSSRNPFWRDYHYRPQDPKAHDVVKTGRQAYVGLSGIIWNLYGESYLDSSNDRGENYVIVSVTKKAAQKLKEEGGLEKMDERNMELWKLNQKLADATNGGDETEKSNVQAQMDAILAHPGYTGIKVYVHPLGIQSLGHHLTRLLELNPRTPYEFKFYEDGSNDSLYKIYADYEVRKCLGELEK